MLAAFRWHFKAMRQRDHLECGCLVKRQEGERIDLCGAAIRKAMRTDKQRQPGRGQLRS